MFAMAFSCLLELFPYGGIPEKPATDLLGLCFLGLAFLHSQQGSRTLLVSLSTATCEDSRGEREWEAEHRVSGSWSQIHQASLGLGLGRLTEQLQIVSEDVKTDGIIEPRTFDDSQAALPRRSPQTQTANSLGLLSYLFLEATCSYCSLVKTLKISALP